MKLGTVTIEELEAGLIKNNWILRKGETPDFTPECTARHQRLVEFYNRLANSKFNIRCIYADEGSCLDYDHRGRIACNSVTFELSNRPANDKSASFSFSVTCRSYNEEITLENYKQYRITPITGTINEDTYSVMGLKKYGARKSSSRGRVFWTKWDEFFNNLDAMETGILKKWEKAALENDKELKAHAKGVINKELYTDEVDLLVEDLTSAIQAKYPDPRVHFESRSNDKDTDLCWNIFLTNHFGLTGAYYDNPCRLQEERQWRTNREYWKAHHEGVTEELLDEKFGSVPPVTLKLLGRHVCNDSAPLWRVRRNEDTTYRVDFNLASRFQGDFPVLNGHRNEGVREGNGFNKMYCIEHLENTEAVYTWILRCLQFLENMDIYYETILQQAAIAAARF